MSSREDYVEAIKTAFVTVGKQVIQRWLLTNAPFFATGFFNSLVMLAVSKILEILVTAAEMAIFFLYTDFRVNAQGNDFVSAALKNYYAQKSGTLQEKAIAEHNLIISFDNFGSLKS